MTKGIENNKYTIGIFLDLSKAFDTVNHSILLKKLVFFTVYGTHVINGLLVIYLIGSNMLNMKMFYQKN